MQIDKFETGVFYLTLTLTRSFEKKKLERKRGRERNKKYVDFNTNFENPLEGRLNISFFSFFFFFFLKIKKKKTPRNSFFLI